MGLSLNQRKWVVKNIEKLLVKYASCFPLTDDKWKELHDDVLGIAKKARNDKAIEDIFLEIYNFFDKLDRAYKKGCGEDVS